MHNKPWSCGQTLQNSGILLKFHNFLKFPSTNDSLFVPCLHPSLTHHPPPTLTCQLPNATNTVKLNANIKSQNLKGNKNTARLRDTLGSLSSCSVCLNQKLFSRNYAYNAYK